MNKADTTPAQTYALVFGAVLLLAGIIGFFWEASFDGDARNGVLGVLDVNGWHNLVHIASGALGLLAWRAGAATSRQYALALGLVYLVVVVWGFIVGDNGEILGLIPVNTEDNILHLLISLLGFGAYAASADRRPARAATT
jgi:predicted small integral membrane protein